MFGRRGFGRGGFRGGGGFGRRGWGPRGRGQGVNPMVAMGFMRLVQQIMQSDFKPPVTLTLMAINVLVFFVRSPSLPTTGAACLMPSAILYNGEFARLVTSAFYHGTDMHLYFNMASLLYKGLTLERHFGSTGFAQIVLSMLLGSHILYVAVAWASVQLGLKWGVMWSCAIGFSAVLFALKVIVNLRTLDSKQRVFGFPIQSKYAAWAELLIIQLLVPQASFLGHLCGILVGLAWVYLPPLARIKLPGSVHSTRPHPGFWGSGTTGGGSDPFPRAATAGTTGGVGAGAGAGSAAHSFDYGESGARQAQTAAPTQPAASAPVDPWAPAPAGATFDTYAAGAHTSSNEPPPDAAAMHPNAATQTSSQSTMSMDELRQARLRRYGAQ